MAQRAALGRLLPIYERRSSSLRQVESLARDWPLVAGSSSSGVSAIMRPLATLETCSPKQSVTGDYRPTAVIPHVTRYSI